MMLPRQAPRRKAELKSIFLVLGDQMALAGWDHCGRKLGGDGASLLNDGVAQKHRHHVLVVIEQAVPVNVTQVPNLTELILLEACLHQNVSRLACRPVK